MAPSASALFEDRFTDARMRRTIPEFAFLGAAIVAGSSPFLVPTTTGRLFVAAAAVAAVGLAFGIQLRGFIDRMAHGFLWVLLVAYCVLIAAVTAATEDPTSPYRLLAAVPVTFAATFFTGWRRYSIAVVAPLVEYLIVGAFVHIDEVTVAGRFVMWLFLAHFGCVVAGTLRETLRSTRALHTVLEASTGAPLGPDLTGIGLDAAMEVVRWERGCVLLREGDQLVLSAHRGMTEDGIAEYAGRPRLVTESGPLADAVRTGESFFAPDVRELLPADALLVRKGARSLAIVPLVHHGESLGALLLADPRTHAFDERLQDRLERVAGPLALGSAAAFRRETEVSSRLRELNRRKDDFLANVSHELRTPAATIKLVAATLRTSSDRLDNSQRAEMYDTLERRAAQLVELIESLLEQAVAETGGTRLAVSTLDWREAVVRWAEIAQLQTGREIRLDVPAGAVIGSGDAVKLERVVANLLSNAAKFSPAGSPITIALRSDQQWVEVEVTDHGHGIPEDQLDRVFDRFHQLESGPTRPAGGFGIGLSLVQHFVNAHGGTVTVRSRVGAGSTFTVRVPRTPMTVAGSSVVTG